jgi:hypothetical protein
MFVEVDWKDEVHETPTAPRALAGIMEDAGIDLRSNEALSALMGSTNWKDEAGKVLRASPALTAGTVESFVASVGAARGRGATPRATPSAPANLGEALVLHALRGGQRPAAAPPPRDARDLGDMVADAMGLPPLKTVSQ